MAKLILCGCVYVMALSITFVGYEAVLTTILWTITFFTAVFLVLSAGWLGIKKCLVKCL